MRVGILTHYDVNNQGAQLQLYAMCKVLESLGHTPIVLTYKKNYDFNPELELRNQITISSIPYIIKNYLLSKGFCLTLHNVKKWCINKRFRNSRYEFESYCYANIDAAIVGADEVFSLELGANMMMYGHCVNTDNMIAYAPSMGQTDINRIKKFHCVELIKSGLSKFSSLSARDENTRKTIKALVDIDVKIVCDPVLLYKFPIDSYSTPVRIPKRDYIVVYSYDARFVDKEEVMAIKQYAHENNLLIVSPGTYHGWCDINIACDALQWLKYIYNAKMVITDTFHGTIASVIMGRPMALYYSKEINSIKMFDLIDRLGLIDRMMSNVSYDEICRVMSHPVDWTNLNKKLSDFREDSLNYLVAALNKVK